MLLPEKQLVHRSRRIAATKCAMARKRLWTAEPRRLAYRGVGPEPGHWRPMQKISAAEWREVFALLDAVHEVPVAGRAAWLARLDQHPAPVLGMLRELLARQTADGFL